MSTFTYAEQLEDAVAAIRILPRSRFSWKGRETAGHDRDGLRDRLKAVLYGAFYSRGGRAGSAPGGAGWPNGDPAFVAAISRRNRGTGGWEPDWVVLDSSPRHLVIKKDGLTLWAPRAECRSLARPAPGSFVELWYPNERRHALPGFYVAFGDEPLPTGEPLVRVYWNVTSDGAPLLIGELTSRLNRAGVPFQLKLVDHPSGYDRCDAAVLYFPACAAGSSIPIVADTHRWVTPEMGSRVPALTRRLADGLGFAEDPGGRDSFGTHRCGLIADGVLHAHDAGATQLSHRVHIVTERFTTAGIDPSRPYQRSLDLDRMVNGEFDGRTRRARPPTDPRRDLSFLGAAAAIGQRLCDEAIWDGDACNWVGPWDDPATGGHEHRSLDHDLYAGTSGIGWFLADLGRALGDDRVSATAIGALRHALSSTDRSDAAALDVGLFTGLVGVAVAANHVASVLNDDDLRAAVNRLIQERLEHIADWDDADANVDFISGRAGAVVGLLILHRTEQDNRLLTVAAALGTDLMDRANRTVRGDSWSAPRIKATHDLTGLSHGAAGPALALAELSVATGSREFREGAERALAYERSWFDASSGNWPDFRADRSEGAEPDSSSTLWCHGATGIGLTRLRLAAILDDASMAAEARQAMMTVRSAVERSLRASGPSWCLCHGLAGNADALHAGSVTDDPAAAGYLETSRAVGRAGTKRVRSWTKPGADGLPLGLMTGLAGIGLFLLRLGDPTIPSPLLMHPDDSLPLTDGPRQFEL